MLDRIILILAAIFTAALSALFFAWNDNGLAGPYMFAVLLAIFSISAIYLSTKEV